MGRPASSRVAAGKLGLVAALAAAVALLGAHAGSGAAGTASNGARTVTPRGELGPDERANIQLFETTKNAVVYISTSGLVRDIWSRNVQEVPRGTGSGFLWDAQGHIVTNYHVIAGASRAKVKLADGRDYAATLVGASQEHDIAVLRIGQGDGHATPVPIGTSGDLRVGQRVFAIGNPFGLDWTMTTGIVSALDRTLDESEGNTIEHLIQTDASINPGNSGGVLLDSAGRLVGMTTAIYSPTGASAGIGFAVPVDTLMRVVPQLIRLGHYVRPVLGLRFDEELNRRLEQFTGIEGAFVLRVPRESAAEHAGLQGVRVDEDGAITPADVITAIGGKPVRSVSQLVARLDDFKVGDEVSLDVVRKGAHRTVRIALQAGR